MKYTPSCFGRQTAINGFVITAYEIDGLYTVIVRRGRRQLTQRDFAGGDERARELALNYFDRMVARHS